MEEIKSCKVLLPEDKFKINHHETIVFQSITGVTDDDLGSSEVLRTCVFKSVFGHNLSPRHQTGTRIGGNEI